jgi:hypothetical protein
LIFLKYHLVNLDTSGVIAISYGGDKTFRIRDKKTKQIVENIPMKNLDILHMVEIFKKNLHMKFLLQKK